MSYEAIQTFPIRKFGRHWYDIPGTNYRVEGFLNKDGVPLVQIFEKRQGWRELAIEYHKNADSFFHNCTFLRQGKYTICLSPANNVGVAKRSDNDEENFLIGQVAAYARMMGIPFKKLIGAE